MARSAPSETIISVYRLSKPGRKNAYQSEDNLKFLISQGKCTMDFYPPVQAHISAH